MTKFNNMGSSSGEEDDQTPKRTRRRGPSKDTEEYRVRRDRNNDAVKKSRDRTRQKTQQTLERVSFLKMENEKLEQQVQILSKELGILRDLFKMVHRGEASGASGAAEQGDVAASDETPAPEPAATAHETAYECVPEIFSEMDCVEVEIGDIKSEDDEGTSFVDGTPVNETALLRDHVYYAQPPAGV